jgi:hypothetical protein
MSKAKKISQKATNTTGSVFVAGDYQVGATSIVADMGAIGVIFKHVIANIHLCESYGKSKPSSLIKVEEKIKINFQQTEMEAVARYYSYAIPKLKIIEEYFQTLDPEEQADIHGYLFEMYIKNKTSSMVAIDNLHNLFDAITPPNQKQNAQYKGLSRALVLFFFEDCTIFEKIPSEQTAQLTFWPL